MSTVLAAALASGCLTGLVAVGIVMIFRTSGIVNFAQGEFMTLAAYVYIPLTRDHASAVEELLLTILAGLVLGVVFFAITELFLARAEPLIQMMATFALSLLIVSLAANLKGSQTIPVPGWYQSNVRIHVLGTYLTGAEIISVVAAVVIIGLLTFVVRATPLGKDIEAVAEDRRAASLCGISPRRTIALSWMIGGALTGLAGLLYAPLAGVTPTMGANELFPAFVAATLGGFSSVTGAAIGGIAVGVVGGLADYYLGGGSIDVVAVFALLIVVLLLKPSGFGGRLELRRI
jgi:branched-chain amino acid transport system permease protein